MAIERAAVIGAGVMGAGIAAHLANAGLEVQLLDIVPPDKANRNVIAETAIERMLRSRHPQFTHPRNARRVTPGNIEDDLNRLADCDWIIEAVIENLEIKQTLFRAIDSVRKPQAPVSSNTSTIPLADLIRGQSERFRENFLITHFFNPPRQMRLLEIIAGDTTRPERVAEIREFCDIRLGKGIVDCKDTPGFICNRIGVFWLQTAIWEAIRLDLSIEDADAIMGPPLGIPKTGVFGLLDLIGLDLMPQIIDSIKSRLPLADPFHSISELPEVFLKMLDEGNLGRKTRGGFYRLAPSGRQNLNESIDLRSTRYRPYAGSRLQLEKAISRASLVDLMDSADAAGQYAWKVLSAVLNYTASLVAEISDSPFDIDRAMKLGYNWKLGPFELIDLIGADYLCNRFASEDRVLSALIQRGQTIYQRSGDGTLLNRSRAGKYIAVPELPGVLSLQRIRCQRKPVLANSGASLYEIGESVVCLEFHSRMNALDTDILDLTRQAAELAADRYCALVIYNGAANFSVGANLVLLARLIRAKDWNGIEQLIRCGQATMQAIKYTPVPVVAAPQGLALGGGAEILLHCDAVQTHMELFSGLVETRVGLIPAWGGCTRMLLRSARHPATSPERMNFIREAFDSISQSRTSGSAEHAIDLGLLQPGNPITMNSDRLPGDARNTALLLAENYQPPAREPLQLPEQTTPVLEQHVQELLISGDATDYDHVILDQLLNIFSGGRSGSAEIDEQTLLDLELEAFNTLVRQPETAARIEHMLRTGKPLRN